MGVVMRLGGNLTSGIEFMIKIILWSGASCSAWSREVGGPYKKKRRRPIEVEILALRGLAPRSSGATDSPMCALLDVRSARWTRAGLSQRDKHYQILALREPSGSIRELRFLPVTEIHVRPILRTCDKSSPHRICQDVISLLPPAFVVSQTVFKEIILPCETDVFARPFLPFGNDATDGFVRRRERQQGVQMIRHQQKQIRHQRNFSCRCWTVSKSFSATSGKANWFRKRCWQLMVMK